MSTRKVRILSEEQADEKYVEHDELPELPSTPSVPTYIQQTEPVVTGPAIWYQTDENGQVIKKYIQVS